MRATELSRIGTLGATDDVGSFACGDEDLDRFLRERAAIEQAMKLSQVYVTTNQNRHILAFFTLSPISVRIDSPPLLKRLGLVSVPYPVIGGFLLGRLAVDRSLQGKGIGAALVVRAAQMARKESEAVGGVFLAVDPKTDRLVTWYSRLGFSPLGGRTRRMVLPFASVPG